MSPAPDDLAPDSNAITVPNTTSHGEAQVAKTWVTKRDRHMQLINSDIYDKEAQSRNKAIEETRKQKSVRRDQREKQKIERHLITLASTNNQDMTIPTIHEITINGLRFQVLDGGSKLARIRGERFDIGIYTNMCSHVPGPTDSASSTPKQAMIGGVTFFRSKNGNLYRSGIVKANM